MQFPHSPLARIAAVAARGRRVRLAAPAMTQQTTRISITTGGTGGVYYPMGGGMANILSKYVPGLSATAEVTGGSVDNLKLINAGKSEVGFIMADAGWDAYQGLDKFKDWQGQRANAAWCSIPTRCTW
jgi:TRAP transporter TAXI family solute receptor